MMDNMHIMQLGWQQEFDEYTKVLYQLLDSTAKSAR